MDADARRRCPYCAEDIRPEAQRCPHCRSTLTALDPARWYRDRPERRIAGVAAAVAPALGVSVAAVRVVFIVLTFVHVLGPVLYGALWLVIPFTPGGSAPLERFVAWVRDVAGRFLHGDGSRAVPGDPRP
jgi:phage shock protein PspC (stress-responsive transcriptional regulator)